MYLWDVHPLVTVLSVTWIHHAC